MLLLRLGYLNYPLEAVGDGNSVIFTMNQLYWIILLINRDVNLVSLGSILSVHEKLVISHRIRTKVFIVLCLNISGPDSDQNYLPHPSVLKTTDRRSLLQCCQVSCNIVTFIISTVSSNSRLLVDRFLHCQSQPNFKPCLGFFFSLISCRLNFVF
jgi:hypothetical protein